MHSHVLFSLIVHMTSMIIFVPLLQTARKTVLGFSFEVVETLRKIRKTRVR
jgi:hypothetical protein